MKAKAMNRALILMAGSLLGFFALVDAVSAQPGFSDSDQWQFRLTPLYIWGVGIKGDVGAGPVNDQADIKFEDVFDNLSAIFTVHFEASRGPWTVFGDASYLNLDPTGELPTGGKIDVDFKNTLFEIGGSYRVAGTGQHRFDVLGGVRVFGLDLETKLRDGPDLVSADATITDGFIGGRYAWKLHEHWSFSARGDIGTGDSDLVWNTSLLLHYQFSDRFSALFGYRWLDYDFETGSGRDRVAFDARMEGPLAGLSINW